MADTGTDRWLVDGVPFGIDLEATTAVCSRRPTGDALLLHSWVSEERAVFWGMTDKSVEEVRDVYAFLDALATHQAYLVHDDDRPVAIFQTYEPLLGQVLADPSVQRVVAEPDVRNERSLRRMERSWSVPTDLAGGLCADSFSPPTAGSRG